MSLPKYPEPINGFDFIIGKTGRPTWRHKKKMIANELVPEEVKAQLLTAYEELTRQRNAENEAAAAAEAANEAEEILQDVQIEQPTPEMQPAPISDTLMQPTPQEGNDAGSPEQTAPFDTGEPVAPLQDQLNAAANLEHDAARVSASLPKHGEVEMMQQELDRRKDIIANLTKATIFEASLEDIAKALAERFNIYTVFLGRDPQDGDIHPIKAAVMNQYDMGLAYKERAVAINTGLLANFDITYRQAIERPRYERPQDAAVAPLPPQMKTMEQHERSHLNRETKNAESYGIDGVIQDPPIFNRRPIVDDSWLHKAKTIDQFDLEEL